MVAKILDDNKPGLHSKHFQSSYCTVEGGRGRGRGRGRGGGGGEKRKRLTNRLPLDYQICKITLFSNRTRSRLKESYNSERLLRNFLFFYCVALSRLKPCRNVKNDLSGTIHSAGCKFCRAAALQPVSKRSLQ